MGGKEVGVPLGEKKGCVKLIVEAGQMGKPGSVQGGEGGRCETAELRKRRNKNSIGLKDFKQKTVGTDFTDRMREERAEPKKEG